jgi:hypothetical protein
MSDTQPPLEFFLTSSATGLQSFELSRMNRAANLRKELRQIMEEWIQAEVNARFARWVLESRRPQALAHRADLLTAGDAQPARSPACSPARSFEQLSISFLPAHEGPLGPFPDALPGALQGALPGALFGPSPELPPAELASPELPSPSRAAVAGIIAGDLDDALGPMAAEAVAASETVTKGDERNAREEQTIDPDARPVAVLPVDALPMARAGTPATRKAATRTAAALSSRPSETPAELPREGSASEASTHDEPKDEINGEPASALERCAQQSAAVLHSRRGAVARLGRAAPARRAAWGSCATLLRPDAISASATGPGSRACVRAVA